MKPRFEILYREAPISRAPGTFPTLGYYGWPSVAVDENEVTYAVVSKRLRHIDPYGKVMLYKSADKGLTWDEGTCLIDTVLDDRDAGILYLGGGRFLVTSFSHSAHQYCDFSSKSFTAWQAEVGPAEVQKRLALWENETEEAKTGCSSYILSDDYGQTWSERKIFPLTAPHGPTLLPDGTVMYLGVPHHADFAGTPLAPGVYCFLSRDGGQSWKNHARLPVDAARMGCEAYGIALRDGSIVACVRTGDFHTLILRSADGGASWTDPMDLTYGAPGHLLETRDGRVLLTYAKRRDVTGQVVRLSSDGGVSWSEESYLSRPRDPADGDLGYPAAAQYRDGTLITVFYQKYGDDPKPSLLRVLWKLGE